MKFQMLMLMTLLFLSRGSVQAADETVTVVVNENNPVVQLSVEQVTDYFLKKKRHWPDDNSVRFIDHRDDSEERAIFLRHFLKKTDRELDLFWIAQKLTGDSEPMQVASNAMICSLVAKITGAISYVSSDFTLPKGVKKVEVTGL